MDALEKKTRDSLTSIRTAGAAGLYLSLKAMAAIVASGLVLQNPTMKDAKGNLATKLTAYGLNYLNSPEGTDPATVTGDKTALASDAALSGDSGDSSDNAGGAVGPVTSIAGRTGRTFARVAMALPTPSNQRQSSYPTDVLTAPTKAADGTPLYDSIFLEPTDDVADASKAFPAVASAATKRFKDATPPRKFTSRVMDGAPYGKPGVTGVAVFRIE